MHASRPVASSVKTKASLTRPGRGKATLPGIGTRRCKGMVDEMIAGHGCRQSRSVWRGVSGWLALCLLMLVPGCGGCLKESESKDDAGDATKTQQAKQDFQTMPAVLYPGVFQDEAKNNRTKPGHWVTGAFRGVANNFDATGELHAWGTDNTGRILPIPQTEFYADSKRPVSLPKGQEKAIETLLYLPKRDDDLAKSVSVLFRIMGGAGLPIMEAVQPVVGLRPFQYHIVALVDDPEAYKFLRALDCVQLPTMSTEVVPAFYHLVFPDAGRSLPLAPNALAWTTIAYVFWDNLDPQSLTPEQQVAMIDWLHFGGQIIISGPNTLERLQNSFLSPYLPATSIGGVNLTDSDLVELNRRWSTPILKSPERKWEFRIPESAPMLGVKLQLADGAEFVSGTGELAAERRVGRGRVAVTAFSMRDLRFKRWQCNSSFIHNALLRRPYRKFEKLAFDQIIFNWADHRNDTIFSPLIGSTLRFLTRDLAGVPEVDGTTREQWFPLSEARGDIVLGDARSEQSVAPEVRELQDDPDFDTIHYGGFGFDRQGGMGTWNDQHGIPVAARESISRIAGINPPKSDFVLKMLGIYLLVLVPLNWLVFRLMGRVEWAWIMMPVLSIVGAVAVVKMASLDIGFARSRSQIGVLELQGGFSRGHLTEYSALYTSLSTPYAVEMENPTGLALPFGNPRSKTTTGATRAVYIERGNGNWLKDFLVRSNSTGMLHQECLQDIEGPISLSSDETGDQLDNGSRLNLQNVGVVKRVSAENYQLAWVGSLDAGDTVMLEWNDFTLQEAFSAQFLETRLIGNRNLAKFIWAENNYGVNEAVLADRILEMPQLAQWREGLKAYFLVNPLTVSRDQRSFVDLKMLGDGLEQMSRSELNGMGLQELNNLISEQMVLGVGEIRMLGQTDQEVSAVRLKPAATQNKTATLVLVHLKLSDFPPAVPDENTIYDFIGRSDLFRSFEDSLDSDLEDELGTEDQEGEMEGDGGQDGNREPD